MMLLVVLACVCVQCTLSVLWDEFDQQTKCNQKEFDDERAHCWGGTSEHIDYPECGWKMNYYTDEQTAQIDTVHIVFTTHWDFGYTDHMWCSFNRYFTTIFEEVEATKQQFPDYKYTLHPYIAYMFLHCERLKPVIRAPLGTELQCPTATVLKRFESLVLDGTLVWHGWPWEGFNELYSSDLIEFGVDFVRELDNDPRWNGKVRHKTTIMQIDVPGISSALSEAWRKQGIKGVYIGQNLGAAMPDTPRLFRWKTSKHSTKPEDDMVMAVLGLSEVHEHDLLLSPETRSALAVSLCLENGHAPSYQTVQHIFDLMKTRFPNAKLVTSTVEDFFLGVYPKLDQLPVISEELGNQWWRSTMSDPKRWMYMRRMQKLRRQCIESNECPSHKHSQSMFDLTHFMMGPAEHNFGLAPNIGERPIQQQSWIEKRALLRTSYDIMYDGGRTDTGLSKLADRTLAALQSVAPTRPSFPQYEWTQQITTDITCNNHKLSFNGLCSLTSLDLVLADGVQYRVASTRNVWHEWTYSVGWSSSQLAFTAAYIKKHTNEACEVTVHCHDSRQRMDVFFAYTIMKEGGISQQAAEGLVDYIDEWTYKKHLNLDVLIFGLQPSYQGHAEVAFSYPDTDSKNYMVDVLSKMINISNTISCGVKHFHIVGDGVHTMNYGGNRDMVISMLSEDTPLAFFGSRGWPSKWTQWDWNDGIADDFKYSIFNTEDTNWVNTYPFTSDDRNSKYSFSLASAMKKGASSGNPPQPSPDHHQVLAPTTALLPPALPPTTITPPSVPPAVVPSNTTPHPSPPPPLPLPPPTVASAVPARAGLPPTTPLLPLPPTTPPTPLPPTTPTTPLSLLLPAIPLTPSLPPLVTPIPSTLIPTTTTPPTTPMETVVPPTTIPTTTTTTTTLPPTPPRASPPTQLPPTTTPLEGPSSSTAVPSYLYHPTTTTIMGPPTTTNINNTCKTDKVLKCIHPYDDLFQCEGVAQLLQCSQKHNCEQLTHMLCQRTTCGNMGHHCGNQTIRDGGCDTTKYQECINGKQVAVEQSQEICDKHQGNLHCSSVSQCTDIRTILCLYGAKRDDLQQCNTYCGDLPLAKSTNIEDLESLLASINMGYPSTDDDDVPQADVALAVTLIGIIGICVIIVIIAIKKKAACFRRCFKTGREYQPHEEP